MERFYYAQVISKFSEEELSLIAQVKRFLEWIDGDIEFRERVEGGRITEDDIKRLREIGVNIDIKEFSILWEDPEFFRQVNSKARRGKKLTEKEVDKLKNYPLIRLWLRYLNFKEGVLHKVKDSYYKVPKNPRFSAWRLRRIRAIRSELGYYGYVANYPTLAFELGDGCSIGCWFCAFAAKKLTKNFDYNENKEMFREIVRTCVDLFGRVPAGMALLYHGTEPHDNPNYLDFLRDYEEITGFSLCTSTAVGTDLEWIRSLIAFYRKGPHPWPRISVLSKEALYKLHENFSPDELRDVELLMQMREHPRPKVKGGRILEEEEGLRGVKDGRYTDKHVPQGTIACVVGFLINMVEKTIKVISPCYATRRWPYGYRIFDEDVFTDEKDFRKVMENLIERSMPTTPYPDMPIRFRDDLLYKSTEKGFDLVSRNQIHHFEGGVYPQLGKLISEDSPPYKELVDRMVDDYGHNPFVVIATVQRLFNEGFLDEVGIKRYRTQGS